MPDPRPSSRGREPAGTADPGAPERGFTLIELIVTMLILSIVMIVVLNSFTTIMTSQTRQASISNSQSQLALAFIALDQEVRYSTGITTPDQSGSDYYVEFQYWTPTNTAECAELQYAPGAGTLDQRLWPVPAAGTSPSPGGWRVLASGLTTAGQPFALVQQVAGAAYDTKMQQLRIDLTATADAGGTGQASSQSDVTFTAVDSSTGSSSSGSTTPAVCTGVTPS